MHIPLQNTKFQLDASGVAGFFGGDVAISAMATVHVYKGRRLLGWYNSPGSYTVAQCYGRLAHSRFWNGLFPGGSVDASILFEFDGSRGPEFKAGFSGTVIKDTGHTGRLFMKECESLEVTRVEGRKTAPMWVTVATLETVPDREMKPTLLGRHSSLLAALPMLSSLCGCAL